MTRPIKITRKEWDEIWIHSHLFFDNWNDMKIYIETQVNDTLRRKQAKTQQKNAGPMRRGNKK